jgi:hypothetical protein
LRSPRRQLSRMTGHIAGGTASRVRIDSSRIARSTKAKQSSSMAALGASMSSSISRRVKE